MLRNATVVTLLALGLTVPARAQLLEDYHYKGKVQDQAGKPLEGVQITFKQPQTGTRISFSSKADGTFDRRMIPHAVYEVTFEKTGYVSHKETFDWSPIPEKAVEKTSTITLESEAELAKKDLGKKASKLYEEAYAALGASDCAKAAKNANELLELGAGSYEYAVRFVLARCHAVANENDAAIADYRKVIEMKPDLYEAHFDLATVLEAKGDHDGALAAYGKAAELKPDDAELRYTMGAILFNQGKKAEARPHFEKAAELNPAHSLAHKALGFELLQSQPPEIEAAVMHLKRYLELEPSASDAAQIQEILKGAESMKAAGAKAPAASGKKPGGK